MRNNVKRRRASSGGGGLTTQTLLDFDLGESSSDSDFRIEDHDESDDCSLGSKDDGDDDGDDDDDDEDEDDDDDDESGEDSGDDSEDNGEAGAGSNPLLQLLHGAQNGGGNEEEEDESTTEGGGGGGQAKGRPPAPAAKQTSERDAALQKLLMKSICCACLGDRSDDQNEIVECDGCGVTVHEGCYGVSECTSVTSTISSCSTEPWFCDACKAGVENPDCELCPNKGGIFKETDVGRWVHLVCALYVPGVAFGEVDQLSSVTLFEMPYNKWGAKTCCLCEDAQLARTGVCIGCDAGMCKTYFHVTCAQYYGLLSEAHSEEADQADPFYAHCKIHSDKSLIKHRKRNYNTIRMRAVQRQVEEEGRRQQKPTAEQVRIERKLTKHRRRYVANKETKNPPWVPTQKMPRLLITSATACKKLLYKAELMGLDRAAIEFQEAQVASLADVRKKWHIPPAFSVEFIGYYLDRALRLEDMKKNLQEQMALNQRLLGKQQHLRNRYDQAVAQSQAAQKANDAVRASIARLYEHIGALCPSKALVPVEQIGKPPAPVPAAMTAPPPPPLPPPPIAQPAQQPAPPPEAATAAASTPPAPPPPYVKPHQSVVINTGPLGATPPARTMSVPTAAALKMGVGFPLQNLMVPGKRDDTGRILSTQCKQNSEELLNECGICKRCHDQHLLAKCDTCHLHYHLGCLNPPLTRHPKKSKLYGWQCSECDQSDDSNPESIIIPKAPRKSRTRYSKDGTIVPYDYAFPPDTQPQAVEAVGRRASRAGPAAVEVKDEPVAESTNEAVDPSPVKTPGKRGRKKKSLEGVAVGETTTTAAITAATNLAIAAQSKEVKQQKKKSDPKLPDGKGAADEELGEEEEEEEARQSDEHSGKHSLLNTTPSELDTSDEQRASEGGSSKMAKVESTTHHHHHHHHHQHHHPGPPPAPTAGSSEATAAHTNAQPPAPEGSSEALAADGGGGGGGREPPGAMGGLPASVEDGAATSTHHKHSKRRKEKHRNRSPNADRPISKDHKRKRKRKNHDYETVDQTELAEYPLPEYGDSRPRIKIKIKSVLDGSNTHTTQIYYVRTEPQEEEPTEPQLTSGAADSSSQAGPLMSHPLLPQLQPAAQFNGSTEQTTITQGRARVKRDVGSRHNASSTTSIGSSVGSSGSDECICDVCQGVGTSANIVQCDECQKSYHFGCLEPPLKKTPKRRGYSWHCADCDPTDVEN